MLTTTHKLSFKNETKGRRKVKEKPTGPPVPAKIPHVSRLMGLAIRCDELIQTGVVKDQAELAELAHVTRSRLSQIMNLLYLAPDIQEEILFFEPQDSGIQPINEPKLRKITGEVNWGRQREVWRSAVTEFEKIAELARWE